MASKSPRVIDGFASVQAVRRHGGTAAEPRFAPSRTRLAATDPNRPRPDKPSGAPGRVGRSVVPQAVEIVCYACGYRFPLTAKLDKVFCPKCREQLDKGEHDIAGRYGGRLRTIGTVTIKAGAEVRGAHIVAGHLVLDGHIEDSTVKVCRRLTLGSHAGGASQAIGAAHLEIAADARLALREPLRCATMDVRGELDATLDVEECVRIHPGGCLRGLLRTARLAIVEGGGLCATVRAAPDAVVPAGPTSPAPPAPTPQPTHKKETDQDGNATRTRTRTRRADSRRG